MPTQKDSKQSSGVAHRIEARDIVHEMKESYLTYAMSVIISRALPDVRDGLKPVQRRILYAMHEMGLRHTAKTVKSARIVGDTMGKYHPHGDLALYDSLVRMAQPFSLRYPLVIGQGNFGSIDGDSAAAMRYTEAKMSARAEAMLADIEKQTVDFIPNYDNRLREPKVLPARIPNLLVNGSMGIAVGMATNIPPHNMSEVADALRHLLKNSKASTGELLHYIQGPDFPTGGIIFNKQDIAAAYSIGKGSFVCRGRAEIMERVRAKRETGDFDIVITEIPYEVNKANMISRIAELVEQKKIDGIRDVRDESDKDGLRVVVELKPGAQAQKILNQLFKFTDLEKIYHMNMIALVDGIQPQTLSLKEILQEFLKHRKSVVVKRTQFDLQRTEESIHILQGLARALDHIDEIIKIIRASESRDKARENLIKKFKLSDKQADAILAIRLEHLARLEREKVHAELAEKQKYAKELQNILNDPRKILDVIDNELQEIKTAYGDARKTAIERGKIQEINEEELIPEAPTVVTVSRAEYIRRINPEHFRVQKRGGKGVMGFEARGEDDAMKIVVSCSTHDTLMFFTDTGKIFFLKPYDLPESSRVSRGKPINNYLGVSENEKIVACIPYHNHEHDSQYLVLTTRLGITKKCALKEIMERQRNGIRIITPKKDDVMVAAGFSTGKDNIILATQYGKVIRFFETQIRAQGRATSGIKGMTLKNNDAVIGMGIVSKEQEKTSSMLVVTQYGFSKMTPLKQYRMQRRGGSGIKTAKITNKTGVIVSATVFTHQEALIVVSQNGQTIRIGMDAIPVQGRLTQGVHIMKLDTGDCITSTTCI